MNKNNFALKYIYPKEKPDFIGLQIKNGEPNFIFPCMYPEAKTEDELKNDIINLLRIIDKYKTLEKVYDNQTSDRKFPFDAYLWIIQNYIENGYYTEKEIKYTTQGNGRIDWKRTIKNNKLYIGTSNIIYRELVRKKVKNNIDNIITNIHKFCVYESFDKMGWYYGFKSIIEKPVIYMEKQFMIQILQKEYTKTFTDNKKLLLLNMIKLLEGLDNNFYNSNRFDISTQSFEDVFECLIRDEFGNEDQTKFNPETFWHLKDKDGWYKNPISAHSLRPDVILKYKDKICVIDAKYYTYGYTEGDSGLPEAQSIHKQITYAEDIDLNKSKLEGEISDIYNIFMLPYNNEQKYIDYIGYADVSWKSGNKTYEKVYAFTVDLKSLINHKYKKSESKGMLVAELEKELL